MTQDMIFRAVGGHPTPIFVRNPDGSPIQLDGKEFFNLAQASAHFELPTDVLVSMYNATWGSLFPTESPMVDQENDEFEAGENADGDAMSLTDLRLAALKVARYPNVKQSHFDFFVEVCRQKHVNPWSKQLYLSVVEGDDGNETPQIIVGIELLRSIAINSGHYAGSDDIEHETDDQGNLVRSIVTVYRMVNGQRCAFSRSAWWEEYYPGTEKSSLYDEMPRVCLGRCAEAAALRCAFPEELGDFYAVEEWERARTKVRNVELKPDPHEEDAPTSPRLLALSLIDMGVADPQKRQEVMSKLYREFGKMGDCPEMYQTAWKAVKRRPRAYGI